MKQQAIDEGDTPEIDVDDEEGREAARPTVRGLERLQEEQIYVPVIIKRDDQARRHPDDVLEYAIRAGTEQLERGLVSLTLSAVAAGLILGFSAMAVAVMIASVGNHNNPFETRLLTAVVYPVGFIMVIMSGAELFTEHTATAVYPVLDRRQSVMRLLRLWVVVLVGNMAGAAAIAAILVAADEVVNAGPAYRAIAEHLAGGTSLSVLASAVLAGWLMALGAWLIAATPPSVSQIVMIYLVTFTIGAGGLHHAIAGAVEVFAGLMSGADPHPVDVVRFLVLATLGNLLGGSVFVAVLNYSHIRGSQEIPDAVAAEKADEIIDGDE